MKQAKIIGFHGKMYAGKNTLSNYLVGHELTAYSILSRFHINDDGKLIAPYRFDDGSLYDDVMDLSVPNKKFQDWAQQTVYPIVKIYGFADDLKNMCMNMFGLTYEQCYGKDKNTLTKYKWGDLPGVVAYDIAGDLGDDIIDAREKPYSYPEAYSKLNLAPKNSQDFLTAREFMQYLGKLIRDINPNGWINSCVQKILYDESQLAIICDVRFVNEAEKLKSIGAKVVKLTRTPVENSDISEIDLDSYTDFDAIIDNQNMSIQQSCEELQKLLVKWGWAQPIMDNECTKSIKG